MKKIITAIIIAAAFGAATQLLGQTYLLPKYEFTINGFGGLSTLNYKVEGVEDAKFKMGLGGGLGFGFDYFFNDHIALVTGVEAALYRASLTADAIESGWGYPTTNGVTYVYYRLDQFKETQNYLALQVPLMAQFTAPLGSQKAHNFYFGIGGRLGLALWGNYHQSADVMQLNNIQTPIKAKAATAQVSPTLPGYDIKEPLKFAILNAMPSVETGIRWKIGKNMGLYTGLYCDYGLLNIIPAGVNEALLMPKGHPSTPTDPMYDGHNSILTAKHPNFKAKDGGSFTHSTAANIVDPPRYTNKVNTLSAGLKIRLAFGTPRKTKIKEVPPDIKQSMIRLSLTLFAFDKFNLSNAAVVELDKAVKWLLDNPDIKIMIEGHTDNKGTPEYNIRLSEERAKSVYDYFVSHGVKPSRLSYRGFGLTRPIATNATDEGRQQNRRVELIVVP